MATAALLGGWRGKLVMERRRYLIEASKQAGSGGVGRQWLCTWVVFHKVYKVHFQYLKTDELRWFHWILIPWFSLNTDGTRYMTKFRSNDEGNNSSVNLASTCFNWVPTRGPCNMTLSLIANRIQYCLMQRQALFFSGISSIYHSADDDGWEGQTVWHNLEK